MNAYNIISIGDAQFLERILNFVAMFSNANLFMKIGLLGAIIGLVLVLVRGAIGSRNLELGALAFSVAMFLVFFGKTATVTVEDYYTGQTYVVDNVPLGTALLGYVISNVGVEITDKMQQGLGDPSTVSIPPQYALTMLHRAEAITAGDLSAVSPDVGSVYRTAIAFHNDCYAPAVRRDTTAGSTVAPLSTSTDAIDDMITEGVKWVGGSTSVFIGGNNNVSGVNYSCKDAGAYLKRMADDTVLQKQIQDVLSGGSDLASPGNGGGGVPATYSVADALHAIDPSIQSATNTNRDVLWNMVMANVDAKAQLTGALSNGDVADSAMIEQAMARRNVQYASEQSVFMRSMRAIMTFFEGLAYGLAPFLAFLIPIGVYGMKLAMRYFQLLFWIFLWMPIMSFVNLFEIMSVKHQMDALPLASSVPGLITTMQGIVQTQYYAGDWIALGGWLATAVIGVSGMIVYGSIAAFNSIASSAHGPDMINESVEVPEIQSQAPMLSLVGAQTYGPDMSMHNPNVAAPSFRKQDVFGAGLGMQSQMASSSVANFNKAYSHAVSEAVHRGINVGNNLSFGTSANLGGDTGSTDKIGGGVQHNQNEASQDSVGHRTELKIGDTASLGASAGVGKGPIGVNGSLGASGGLGAAGTQQNSESTGTNIALSNYGGHEDTTTFKSHEGQIYDNVEQLSSALSKSGDTRDAVALQRSYGEAKSAVDSYTSSLVQSSKFGDDASFSITQIAPAISDWSRESPSEHAAFAMAAQSVAGRQIADEMSYVSGHLMPNASRSEQMAAATFMGLNDVATNTSLGAVQREQAYSLMMQGMSQVDRGFTTQGGVVDGSAFGASVRSAVRPAAAAATEAASVSGTNHDHSVDAAYAAGTARAGDLKTAIDQYHSTQANSTQEKSRAQTSADEEQSQAHRHKTYETTPLDALTNKGQR